MKTIYRVSQYAWDKFTDWIRKPDNQMYFMVTVFVISILPLLALGFYNHPAMDDFNYSVLVKNALRESEGLAKIPAVLGAAVQRAMDNWGRWQGTYAFSFICALRPSAFSEKLTFLQTFILMGLLTGSIYYCCHVILHKMLGLRRQTAAVVGSVILILCVQYVPIGLEAFYWYCGSIGYTGLFSVLCILCAKLMWASHERKLSVKGLILILFLEFVTAGGMYPNALFGAVFIFLLFLDALFGKEYNKSFKIKYTGIFLWYLASFLFNVLAPGNSIRQSNFQPRTPLEAIYKSYTHSLEYLREEGTNAIIILATLALFVYMFYQLKEVKGRFRCPLMFTAVTYSLYVVLWVPGIYAVRFISGGRYYNVIFYALIFFYASNAIYYAGWMRRKYEACGEQVQEWLRKAAPVIQGTLVIVSVIFCLVKVDIVKEIEENNGAKALKSIVYGEAAQYHKEIKAREALYNDPEVRYLVVDDTTVRPELLYYGTLTNDPNDYRNDVMRQYYDKDFMLLIRPIEPEETEEQE
ncbi:MAG: hypothetical protein HFJ10_11600 [Lachnospiraceae bacterium]|nr:hypothetical protein [Lachnospiraceae bacterium]